MSENVREVRTSPVSQSNKEIMIINSKLLIIHLTFYISMAYWTQLNLPLELI